MKAMGTILLLLATVGVLSSWSAMARAGGGYQTIGEVEDTEKLTVKVSQPAWLMK